MTGSLLFAVNEEKSLENSPLMCSGLGAYAALDSNKLFDECVLTGMIVAHGFDPTQMQTNFAYLQVIVRFKYTKNCQLRVININDTYPQDQNLRQNCLADEHDIVESMKRLWQSDHNQIFEDWYYLYNNYFTE